MMRHFASLLARTLRCFACDVHSTAALIARFNCLFLFILSLKWHYKPRCAKQNQQEMTRKKLFWSESGLFSVFSSSDKIKRKFTSWSVFRSALVNDFTSSNDNIWYGYRKLVRTSCALQNKNRTFKTPDIPYFIIWSDIFFLLKHRWSWRRFSPLIHQGSKQEVQNSVPFKNTSKTMKH